jgi:hypothetical protein
MDPICGIVNFHHGSSCFLREWRGLNLVNSGLTPPLLRCRHIAVPGIGPDRSSGDGGSRLEEQVQDGVDLGSTIGHSGAMGRGVLLPLVMPGFGEFGTGSREVSGDLVGQAVAHGGHGSFFPDVRKIEAAFP